MARRRASMREGPLAELFRATEAAQKQADKGEAAPVEEPQPEPLEETVEHAPPFLEAAPEPEPEVAPEPEPLHFPEPVPEPPPVRHLEPLPEPPPRLHR